MTAALEPPLPSNSGSAANDTMALALRVDRLEADLAEAKAQMQVMRALLEIDQLTGLYNRRGLERVFQQVSARCKRHQMPACLVMIDLDDFKQVNDTHGHAEGDHLLKRIAEFFLKHIRTSDVAARLSGDEFCLLLDGTDEPMTDRKMIELRQKLRQVIGAPPPSGRSVSFSFGTSPIDGSRDFDVILADADASMYRDKDRKTARLTPD